MPVVSASCVSRWPRVYKQHHVYVKRDRRGACARVQHLACLHSVPARVQLSVRVGILAHARTGTNLRCGASLFLAFPRACTIHRKCRLRAACWFAAISPGTGELSPGTANYCKLPPTEYTSCGAASHAHLLGCRKSSDRLLKLDESAVGIISPHCRVTQARRIWNS